METGWWADATEHEHLFLQSEDRGEAPHEQVTIRLLNLKQHLVMASWGDFASFVKSYGGDKIVHVKHCHW